SSYNAHMKRPIKRSPAVNSQVQGNAFVLPLVEFISEKEFLRIFRAIKNGRGLKLNNMIDEDIDCRFDAGAAGAADDDRDVDDDPDDDEDDRGDGHRDDDRHGHHEDDDD
ncbi:hypothetical protein LCGC14_1718750, partial [marine sediment metagenome]